MRALNLLCGLIMAMTLGITPMVTTAQGQFEPSILVNNRAVTEYEINQRTKLLELFRTPGANRELAREQLIEDRLKQVEMARVGLVLPDDALDSALEEFAGRANMTLDQFHVVLGQNGVAQESLRDFVAIGISWRDYIRSRFGRRVNITDAEIDRALSATSGRTDGIEVLLSEIIIPAPPQRAAQVQAAAQRISRTRSFDTFSAEARELSALPSRSDGGRLGWLPITNYPPQLRSILLGLATGEVTAPIELSNAVALFQMRGVREVPTPQPEPSQIEYAAYYLSGGQSAARSLADRVDTCDDLYGVAQGQPAEVLERDSLPPSEIPQDVAIELAKLDPGEISYNLTRANGATTVFLMLCNRVSASGENASRDAIRNQLRSSRLAGFADALLADLQATATIVNQ